MTKQIIKDKQDETIGAMLFLNKEELLAFEGTLEDMINYSVDSKNVDEALKENLYQKSSSVFDEIENS